MEGKMNFDGMRHPKPASATPPVEPKTNEPALLTWQANDFERNLTGNKLTAIITILLAIIGYSVWQRDWFMIAIIIIVASVGAWYLNAFKPIKRTYSITAMGIYVDERFYPFSEIHSFWLVYNQIVQELFIAFDKKYLPALTINVKELDPINLKSILLRKIPEQAKRQESLVDKMVRFLGL